MTMPLLPPFSVTEVLMSQSYHYTLFQTRKFEVSTNRSFDIARVERRHYRAAALPRGINLSIVLQAITHADLVLSSAPDIAHSWRRPVSPTFPRTSAAHSRPEHGCFQFIAQLPLGLWTPNMLQ